MIVFKPPKMPSRKLIRSTSVFLAGSIEMGAADEWQNDIINSFEGEEVTFLNPRRDDWDSSWEQSKDNKQFREQVTWELTALELADLIFLYLAPGTKSPISLLELGLHANKGKDMVVCCPEGFWRKGNVDIVCEHKGIICVDDFEKARSILLGMVYSWDKYSIPAPKPEMVTVP